MSRYLHKWWVHVANYLSWLQIVADGLAFLTAVFAPELEPLIGGAAIAVTAMAVTATCIAAGSVRSRSCFKGIMFSVIGLIVPLAGGVAKVLRAGKSAERLLEPFSRLSDEFNFLVDVYEKMKELAGIE